MRDKLYQWPLVLGSVLGVTALIVAFSQPTSEPAAFNHATWLAGCLAVLALLTVGAGILLRLRRDTTARGGAPHAREGTVDISRRSPAVR